MPLTDTTIRNAKRGGQVPATGRTCGKRSGPTGNGGLNWVISLVGPVDEQAGQPLWFVSVQVRMPQGGAGSAGGGAGWRIS